MIIYLDSSYRYHLTKNGTMMVVETDVLTIKGDTNLTAGNIASGVTIFEITGPYQGR